MDTLQTLWLHSVVTGLKTISWQQIHVNNSSTFWRNFWKKWIANNNTNNKNKHQLIKQHPSMQLNNLCKIITNDRCHISICFQSLPCVVIVFLLNLIMVHQPVPPLTCAPGPRPKASCSRCPGLSSSSALPRPCKLPPFASSLGSQRGRNLQ